MMRSYKEVAEGLGLEKYVPLGQVLFKKPRKNVELKVELFENETGANVSQKMQKSIHALWEEHKLNNPNDFDGDVGSIISIFESPSRTWNIEFHKGRFSHFVATAAIRKRRLNVKSFPLDEETCLPISFGAVAITKDNYIIFALRGQTTFDAESVTLLPGGYFNPETDYFFVKGPSGRLEKNYSIAVTVLRELFEETGIALTCLKVDYLGLIYNKKGSRQPLLVCRINLPFTMGEIISRMPKHLDEESKQIFFVENDIEEVKKFLFYLHIIKYDIAIHDTYKLILHFLIGY